jgi:hypothetical protein
LEQTIEKCGYFDDNLRSAQNDSVEFPQNGNLKSNYFNSDSNRESIGLIIRRYLNVTTFKKMCMEKILRFRQPGFNLIIFQSLKV